MKRKWRENEEIVKETNSVVGNKGIYYVYGYISNMIYMKIEHLEIRATNR